MSINWSALASAALSILEKAGASTAPATATVVAKVAGDTITYGGLTSLVSLVKAFPLAEAEALLEGEGTVSDALDITEKALALVSLADPELIPEAGAIELGLAAAKVFYPVLAEAAAANPAATGGLLWTSGRGKR